MKMSTIEGESLSLDFLGNNDWPRELKLLVAQHLSPKDLIVCRVICKRWLSSLEDDMFWKIKIPSKFPDCLSNLNGNYFRVFTRSGVHLIQTPEDLDKCQFDAYQLFGYLSFVDMTSIWIDSETGLGFCYSNAKKIEYEVINDLNSLRNFISEASKFDCPYLAIPTKFFEDDQYFCVVFDNQFEEFGALLKKIPEEEYNERFVVKLVRQLIHAIKYLHDRNYCLISVFGGVELCVKRNFEGEIQLQLLNYTYSLGPLNMVSCYYTSPERALKFDAPSTFKSDLFTLGTLTLGLLSGSSLYNDNPKRVLAKLASFKEESYEIPDPNKEVSDLAKDFILRLLKRNPDDRMTLEEALNHPWLTNPEPSTTPLRRAYEEFVPISSDDFYSGDDGSESE